MQHKHRFIVGNTWVGHSIGQKGQVSECLVQQNLGMLVIQRIKRSRRRLFHRLSSPAAHFTTAWRKERRGSSRLPIEPFGRNGVYHARFKSLPLSFSLVQELNNTMSKAIYHNEYGHTEEVEVIAKHAVLEDFFLCRRKQGNSITIHRHRLTAIYTNKPKDETNRSSTSL